MPVVTRSQTKSAVPDKSKALSFSTSSYIYIKEKALFNNQVRQLILQCQTSVGKENKMNVILKICELVHINLPHRISADGLDTWIVFIAAIYNKTTEFIYDNRDIGIYKEIDQNIIDNFFRSVYKIRTFASDIIKNYCGPHSCKSDISQAKEEITRRRSPRNIARVNYAGMTR